MNNKKPTISEISTRNEDTSMVQPNEDGFRLFKSMYNTIKPQHLPWSENPVNTPQGNGHK